MVEALDIQVKGIVQGVGFRPFVYRLAKKYLINGWVLNATEGVTIHAEGETHLIDEFVNELHMNPPAAAVVKEVDLKEVPLEGFTSFEIRFSDDHAVKKTTLVSPDLATCDDCLAELFNPNDRRYRYPFINCTNCGPRFTIIDKLPYDRPHTSMKDFPMCDRCAAEYADPLDRRFHAQPDACFECGPGVVWWERDASPSCACAADGLGGGQSFEQPCSRGGRLFLARDRGDSDAAFARAVELLLAGKIVAVKGLGGFHLVCDATNEAALAELRRRKRRPGKAFAVMVRTADDARRVCEVNKVEKGLLEGSQRPIVLLRKKPGAPLAVGLADKLPELGVMLPCTPVQHILLHDFEAAVRERRGQDALAMLVMTSGNLHDEPIVTDDAEALEKLCGCAADEAKRLVEQAFANGEGEVSLGGASDGEADGGADGVAPSAFTSEPATPAPAAPAREPIADAMLGNNRAILSRYDDSVLRVIELGNGDEAVQFIRRARGYAPLPVPLKRVGPDPSPAAEDDEAPASRQAADPQRAEQSHQDADLDGSAHPEKAVGSRQAVAKSASSKPPTPLLAVGPEQKATFAIVRPGASSDDPAEALVSQHIGDVENAETYDAWFDAKARYERLFQVSPQRLACDLHPEYLTSKWAREQARSRSLPLTTVQHHHAHIASVLGENDLFGPVCGIAFDGTGYGADGRIWGGEVLIANRRAYERFANFAYVPMPGGAAAVRNPLRMAYGVLSEFDLLDHPGAADILARLADEQDTLDAMIERGINTPYTSSVGRLFDAAAALLGICNKATYEGEPAILLEAALGSASGNVTSTSPYTINIVKNTATKQSTAQDTSVVLLDPAPAFAALLDDKAAGVAVPQIAQRFHDAFVDAVLTVARLAENVYGIRTVALSGGVFMNRYLIQRCVSLLSAAGFTVALNRELPPNDGCISYGQAVVAWGARNQDE